MEDSLKEQDLNTLLNKVLGTNNVEYTNSLDGLQKCQNAFVKSVKNNENNKIYLKVYSYFFPCKSAIEKNSNEFWFSKYKSENPYNEYKFAIDILKSFIQYISDKKLALFNEKLEENILKFNNYKNVDSFFTIIKDNLDNFLAIQAYLTKDSTFFKDTLKINSTDIQSNEFIKKIESILIHRKLEVMNEILTTQSNFINLLNSKIKILESDKKESNRKVQDLENDKKLKDIAIKNLEDDKKLKDIAIKNLEDDKKLKDIAIKNLEDDKQLKDIAIKNLEDDKQLKDIAIKNLENDKKDLEIKIQELKEKTNNLELRLDKIDLRDTLKMSFRYLYNIIYEHFNLDAYEDNFWKQIKILKNTFNKEFNKKYSFISTFIDDLQFENLHDLNQAAHSSEQVRRLGDIKKYLQNISSIDLERGDWFFNSFPYLEDFINLNIRYYFNQEKAEEEFLKKIKYSEVYIKVFGTN